MIEVHLIPILKDNYAYAITGKNLCAVVDPGEAEPVIEFFEAKNLKPQYILNTHHHSDHVAGNIALKEKYAAHIIAPEKEISKIKGVDETVKAGDRLELGSEKIHIIAAEGHTAGGVFFYFKDSAKIFVGDTLFGMGCGKIIEGTAEQLFSALQFLKSLPNETLAYCGHEYTLANGKFCLSIQPNNTDIQQRMKDVEELRTHNKFSVPTTIGIEKKTNLFLQANSVEEFTTLRKMKDKF